MLKGPGRSGRIFGLCLVSAFLLSLVLPSDANAWTRTITFESADIGTSAIDPDNPDLLDTTGSLSVVVYDPVFIGRRAARLGVRKGSSGWGTFGGIVQFPETLHEGDEVWVRTSIWIPNDYLFSDQVGLPGPNKFLRIRTQGAAGSAYVDVYMASNRLRFISEYRPRWRPLTGYGLPREQWATLEYYVQFGGEPHAEGGNGRMKFWIDGELIAEHDDVRTLAPGNFAPAFFLFTWASNEGAPRDQHLYVDEIVVTTAPTKRDVHGNRVIGMPNQTSRPHPPRLDDVN
jgi:hypothetical protein